MVKYTITAYGEPSLDQDLIEQKLKELGMVYVEVEEGRNRYGSRTDSSSR